MTASRWCQRWERRRQSWAYADLSERFDPSGYQVAPVEKAVAKAYCAHHYLRSYPASSRHRFGQRRRRALARLRMVL
jgi:hypothetical protein